jgi:hypothetical protein
MLGSIFSCTSILSSTTTMVFGTSTELGTSHVDFDASNSGPKHHVLASSMIQVDGTSGEMAWKLLYFRSKLRAVIVTTIIPELGLSQLLGTCICEPKAALLVWTIVS